jgi:hypothetical protein
MRKIERVLVALLIVLEAVAELYRGVLSEGLGPCPMAH